MKTKRSIIKIDEELCYGCGACIEGCHEGALQLIDGKARIISDLYCDGLGACIGECPVGAITIEERDAEPYNEVAVMDRISPKGEKTILAHLKHLKHHGEMEFFGQGIAYVKEKGLDIDLNILLDTHEKEGATCGCDNYNKAKPKLGCGCPGSMERSFTTPATKGFNMGRVNPSGTATTPTQAPVSHLTHWPVQLHLLNPQAGFFQSADVVLAADCTAYAYADFHNRFIKNHTLAIACPKLDSNKQNYVSKLVDLIDSAQINTLTVVIMEVPCCGGLMQIAQAAIANATRKVPVKKIVIGVEGSIKDERWV